MLCVTIEISSQCGETAKKQVSYKKSDEENAAQVESKDAQQQGRKRKLKMMEDDTSSKKVFALQFNNSINIIAIFPVSYNMYLGSEICCLKQCHVFLVCWLQNSDFFNKLLQAPSPWHEVTHRIAFCN